MELVTGAIAAGGGCVARAADGRVVFVRHALPGERVVAAVTAETTSFLRADAVEILEPSPDRVDPACPHAGPGRCGGCDWQHVALPAQRRLKSDLVAEQLRRLAGVDRRVEIEEVPGGHDPGGHDPGGHDRDGDDPGGRESGAGDGLGWRTRVRFAVDAAGRTGFHRHRSHEVERVDRCPLATTAVNGVGVGSAVWRGAHHVEVTAPPGGGTPVVSAETGRRGLSSPPALPAGLVVDGRTVQPPGSVHMTVGDHRFEVGAGVFWQVHPAAASVLTECVLAGLGAVEGERAADLYAGAGLFTVALARTVGIRGSVVAVERSARACADATRNTTGLPQVHLVRADVTPAVVARRLRTPEIVVLDPARQGAGVPVMRALASLDPAPRRMAYVSCDPASFARDLRIVLEAGWTVRSLRGFDLFPMTEHVELVCILDRPG